MYIGVSTINNCLSMIKFHLIYLDQTMNYEMSKYNLATATVLVKYHIGIARKFYLDTA